MKSYISALFIALITPFLAEGGVALPNGSLLRTADGSFVGTTRGGGAAERGVIVRITPFSEVSAVASFPAGGGENPEAGLVEDSTGGLWGTASQGGANLMGVIYRCAPATGALEVKVDFSGANGRMPVGPLVGDGAGVFFGTTSLGGAMNFGTVFRFDSSNNSLTTLVEFTGAAGAAPGSEPVAGLLRDGAGVLWGTTRAGGALDVGTIFKVDAGVLTTVAEFTGTNGAAPGSFPLGELIDDGAGGLLGTTVSGGSMGLGTVFRVNKTTGAVTSLTSFIGTNGAKPAGRLVSDGAGFFWGTTKEGGGAELGTIFKINAAGVLTKLVEFTGQTGAARGAYPRGGMTADLTGNLWGAAAQGGREDLGTFWRVNSATGAFTFLVESEVSPEAPAAAIAAPPGSATIGNAGDALTLRGVTSDKVEVVQVLISLNGGPFVPATLTPGVKPGTYAWELAVIPENGVNEVLVRSVDSGGSSSKVAKLIFNYTVIRPEIEGSYTGLVTATSMSPAAHTGMFTLKVRKDGKLTGKLQLGALPKSVSFTGSFGNDGTLRFGKKGLPVLVIPRKNLTPFELTLGLDVDAPLTRQIVGTLKEGAVAVAALLGDQAIYSAKKVLLPPYIRVPVSVLDLATDHGHYTAVMLPFTPAAQGLTADQFPQGAGFATVSVKATGVATFAGKLADGTPFAASAPLSRDNVFPLYAKLASVKGAFSGWVNFRDDPGLSDMDGADLRWFRAPNPKSKLYPSGWADGIGTDLLGSKFVKDVTKTPLGNAIVTGNATIKLDDGLLPVSLENDLSIALNGATIVLGPPAGVTGATGLQIGFTANGTFAGNFAHSVDSKNTPFSGVIFQKTSSAFGFFLRDPESGLVKVTGR